MASALFQLSSDGGSNYLAVGTAMADANALAYVASGTYSMKARLDSTAGVSAVSWVITTADDAHVASLPVVTQNPDKTCTFSVPRTGGAWTLQCTVNGGVSPQTGAADASLVKRLAIKVLNSNGQQEVAVGEGDEAGAHGWTKAMNDLGRGSSSPSGPAGGDLSGTYPNPTVDQLQGHAVSPGVPNTDDILQWTGAAWVPAQLANGSAVVYREDTSTPGGNVYATWTGALAAAQSLNGEVTIYLDPSDATPVIPAGTHNLERRIRVVALGMLGTALPMLVTVASGAVLQNAVYFEGIDFDGALSTPLLTATGVGGHDVTFVRCRREVSPDGDEFATLATGTNRFAFLGGSRFSPDTANFAVLAAGKNVTAVLDGASYLGPEMFGGSAGTLTVSVGAGSTFEGQAFSGTLVQTDAVLTSLAAAPANVSVNSRKITSLATPTADTDAATKAYVDATAQGLDGKQSVRAASTGNLTLSGTQTVDGVALIAGDRCLVKNQTAGAENGIYVVAAGAWARSTDANTSAEVTPGLFTFVEEGTTNGSAGWFLTTPAPIVLGTTALTFSQFSAAGLIAAGAGLTKTGSQLDIVAANATIQVNADSIEAVPAQIVTASAVQTATGALASALPVNGQKITNLGAPTASSDAARKTDVDTAIAGVGTGQLYGMGLDGARSDTGGGSGPALARPREYTTWSVADAMTVSLAGYPVYVRATLTLAASCVLHNDGSAGTDNAAAGGTGAPVGQLAVTVSNGANGGGVNSAGGAGATQDPALGGAGGAGGAGAFSGGAGGTIVLPNTASIGRLVLELLAYFLSGTWTRVRAGAPGGGGSGGATTVGAGGGGPGGMVLLFAQTIVLGAGAKVRAAGGRGGNNSNTGAGAGGGGGGGLVVIFCDSLTMADTYADHFSAPGGAAGDATGGGTDGVVGSAGRVFVFVRGVLVYTNA